MQIAVNYFDLINTVIILDRDRFSADRLKSFANFRRGASNNITLVAEVTREMNRTVGNINSFSFRTTNTI